MEQNEKKPLFQEFPPVDKEAWDGLIAKDLKGKEYERLIWKTQEGFRVLPYYMEEDLLPLSYLEGAPGTFPFVRGTRPEGNEWLIRQDILLKDPEEANRKAHTAIENGAGSLCFVFPDGETKPEGLPNEVLKVLLKEIDPARISLHFRNVPDAEKWINAFSPERNNAFSPDGLLPGSITMNPFGPTCLNGKDPGPGWEDIAGYFKKGMEILPAFRLLEVDTVCFHESGANLVQELGFALAAGSEYLSRLTEYGISVKDLASRIQFLMPVGSSYFLEIAKFRAARYLWSRILEAYRPDSLSDMAMHIHARTSRRNKTVYDPYINMLRTTTEAMAAVLGGVESLFVEAYDTVFREPSDFSERIARNTQLILKEEAYFSKVADPSAGSYYIEQLTDMFIASAWDLFLEIDSQGGFAEALRKGMIQERILQNAEEQKKNLAFRKQTLVGTNQYPNLLDSSDPSLEEEYDMSSEESASLKQKLRPGRLAEPYEKIRRRTEKAAKKPRVFLLALGDPVMRRARVSFSWNFFACAGFEMIVNNGYSSLEDALKACAEVQADITVICSSDEEYPQFVPLLMEKLRDQTIPVVAGYPSEGMEELKKAGITHFIHLRSNVPESLQQFQQELGI